MVDISLWFTLGAVGMLAGTAMLAYGLMLVPSHRRRVFSLIVAVPAIAAVAYGVMALGIGMLTAPDGSPVFVARYIDWLLTTPLHVAVIALVVGASTRLVTKLAVLQALTIVVGFVGAALAAPLSWLLYVVGSVVFAGVIYMMYSDLEALTADQSDEVVSLFRKLRAFVVVLWLVYPVIWVLGPAGIEMMNPETAALVVAYIDVVAKVGFGLIAINDYLKMAALQDALPDNAAVEAAPTVSTTDDDPPAAD